MGSPLSQHPEVQQLIAKIGERDVEYLESLRGKRSPSPTHLMFACATVLGDGGQEHLAGMMKKVPGKQRRDKFIDLAIQLAQAEDSPVESEEHVNEAPVEEVAPPAPAPKPKRKRRTKAEMEAARAAASAPEPSSSESVATTNDPEALLSYLNTLNEAVREVTKAVFAIDDKVNVINERVSAIDPNFTMSYVDKAIYHYTKVLEEQLSAIKEGLCAAELELVMSGKLGTAAISETIEERWPINES